MDQALSGKKLNSSTAVVPYTHCGYSSHDNIFIETLHSQCHLKQKYSTKYVQLTGDRTIQPSSFYSTGCKGLLCYQESSNESQHREGLIKEQRLNWTIPNSAVFLSSCLFDVLLPIDLFTVPSACLIYLVLKNISKMLWKPRKLTTHSRKPFCTSYCHCIYFHCNKAKGEMLMLDHLDHRSSTHIITLPWIQETDLITIHWMKTCTIRSISAVEAWCPNGL